MSMCKMLLSIKPQHVDKILNGNKRFEFRKVRCKENVDKIVIYATSPVMLVVGEADLLEVIEDGLNEVWEITSDFAGISRVFFDEYYQGKNKAIAYRLGNVTKYKEPLQLTDLGIRYAPQSFIYL